MGRPSWANAEYVSIGGSQMRLRTVMPRKVIGSNRPTVPLVVAFFDRFAFFSSSLIVVVPSGRTYWLHADRLNLFLYSP